MISGINDWQEPAETEAPETPEERLGRVIVVPPEWYTTRAPKRVWLLRDSRTGAGVLPLGKVGQVIGEGGVSKTQALVQLAIAVGNGEPWLGTLTIAAPGRVLLALGEEDADEIHRRLHRAIKACESPAPPQRLIVALPLAGIPCAMLERGDNGNVIEASFLWHFRDYAEEIRTVEVDRHRSDDSIRRTRRGDR